MMPFKLFLLFCAVQLSFGEHLFNYYNSVAIAATILTIYYNSVDVAKTEQKLHKKKNFKQHFHKKDLHCIDWKLVEMNLNSKCMNQYYKNYTSLDYFNHCAITKSLDSYSPPGFVDFELVKQIGWNLTNYNMRLIQRCQVEQWFDGLKYYEWRECSEIK